MQKINILWLYKLPVYKNNIKFLLNRECSNENFVNDRQIKKKTFSLSQLR